jgi:hypothetical protein
MSVVSSLDFRSRCDGKLRNSLNRLAVERFSIHVQCHGDRDTKHETMGRTFAIGE